MSGHHFRNTALHTVHMRFTSLAGRGLWAVQAPERQCQARIVGPVRYVVVNMYEPGGILAVRANERTFGSDMCASPIACQAMPPSNQHPHPNQPRSQALWHTLAPRPSTATTARPLMWVRRTCPASQLCMCVYVCGRGSLQERPRTHVLAYPRPCPSFTLAHAHILLWMQSAQLAPRPHIIFRACLIACMHRTRAGVGVRRNAVGADHVGAALQQAVCP